MKCQACGADSLVLATRRYKEVLLRRDRRCFNGHQFTTYEVFAANLDRRAIEATIRGIKQRAKALHTKAVVLKNPHLSSTALAVQLNLTAARINQIRSGRERNRRVPAVSIRDLTEAG